MKGITGFPQNFYSQKLWNRIGWHQGLKLFSKTTGLNWQFSPTIKVPLSFSPSLHSCFQVRGILGSMCVRARVKEKGKAERVKGLHAFFLQVCVYLYRTHRYRGVDSDQIFISHHARFSYFWATLNWQAATNLRKQLVSRMAENDAWNKFCWHRNSQLVLLN